MRPRRYPYSRKESIFPKVEAQSSKASVAPMDVKRLTLGTISYENFLKRLVCKQTKST
nr:MAG TPA: hypothetical protein [Caudoviricetes sp.]